VPDSSPNKGKRQIAKLTKKQLGFAIGQNILAQLSNIATSVRQILEKGTDPATKQPLSCAVEDIKRSYSTEQLIAIEDFYTTFAVDERDAQPGSPPSAAPPVKTRRARK
jgi:hypothetical protein